MTAARDAIAARVADVEDAVAAACKAAGRPRDDVTLVAAAKSQPAWALRAAHAAGVRHFGENYANELQDKRKALADLVDIQWHFIGRVQRGNARAIAAASLVHGVGSLSAAAALAKEARKLGRAVQVLLQVNLEDEATKNGFSEAGLRDALPVLRGLDGLTLMGLMAMPLVDAAVLPAAFGRVARLRDALGPPFSLLSMGMSDDFPAAIAAGATHVRVGTRLFGPRAP